MGLMTLRGPQAIRNQYSKHRTFTPTSTSISIRHASEKRRKVKKDTERRKKNEHKAPLDSPDTKDVQIVLTRDPPFYQADRHRMLDGPKSTERGLK